MTAGNDRTGEGFFQLVKRNIDSRFLKVPAHFFIPENAGIHKSLDLPAEGRHFIINEQSENMDILSHIFGGKFDAGYDFKGIAGIIFHCFIKAVYRVMICEREASSPFSPARSTSCDGERLPSDFVEWTCKSTVCMLITSYSVKKGKAFRTGRQLSHHWINFRHLPCWPYKPYVFWPWHHLPDIHRKW